MLAGSTWEGEFEMLSFIVKVGGGGGGGGGGGFGGEVKFLIDTPLCLIL